MRAEANAQQQQQLLRASVSAPPCCNRAGESPVCKCCGDRPLNCMMLTYGILMLLSFILACFSVGTVWTSFTVKPHNFRYISEDYYVGLWRYRRDGDNDDDYTKVKKSADRIINWSAFETNRAMTIISIILTFPISLYYMISACAGRIKIVEIVLSSLVLVLFVLLLSGSSHWIDEFEDNYFFDDNSWDVKDEVICTGGCAFQVFNAGYLLILGSFMMSFAFLDCCCCKEDSSQVSANDVEMPPVAIIEPASSQSAAAETGTNPASPRQATAEPQVVKLIVGSDDAPPPAANSV